MRVCKKLTFLVLLSALICTSLFLSCSYEPDFNTEDYIAQYETKNENISITKDSSTYILTPENAESALIFYPGAYVDYNSYLPLLSKCAEKGIQIFLLQMPSDLAILKVNAANKIINNPDYSNIKNWYIGGHSLGGAMAANYAAKHSNKLKGLVLLAAYSTENLSKTDLKVLSIYGSNDGVLNKEKYQKCLKNLPSDYEEHVLEGGNHANFGDYGFQDGDNEATMAAATQKELTADYIGAFCK